MNNPKTTIAGYLSIAAAIITMISHLLTGDITGAFSPATFGSAIAGVGLVTAKDGNH